MFRVGDEVVCVDDARYWSPLTPPKIGKVYTIMAVYPERPTVTRPDLPRALGLDLAELPPHPDYSYPAECFRPVAKRSDTLTIESFLTIRPGQFEEPRREQHPAPSRRVKKGVGA